MEMVLIREKLWSIVCKRKLRPEDDDARILEWDEEAERATATIFLCLSEAAEKHVQDLRNPVKIWEKLKDVYEARGFSGRFLLWRNLFNIKPDDLINQLLDESHRRKANAVAELDYNKALAARTNPKKRLRKQCEHCLKPGHLEADCWIKYPSKRPHSEDTVNAKWVQAL